tara:strand:- start:5425 stop:8151 length:2727 start_codon:yes stop_codon:yes gene_type:complete
MQSLFGGGNFPSQPTASGTTVATTEFPKELAPFIKDILEKSKAMQQDASYQPYTGPQIAPFTPLEQDAMTALEAQSRGLAGTDIAQAAPYFTGAKTAIEGLGQQFTGDTAQQFMNPYQQAVTDQAKLKATEDYEKQQQVLAANAIKNQPFGGSRQAITEGMAQGDYLDRLTDIQERGLASAYTQGRAAFEAQKGRELQQANALMGMGAAVPQQAYRDLGIRQQIGETQRAQDQMALDLGTKQFMEEREFPTRALQEYSATVRGFPFQPSTYQTQTSYQPKPGIGQQLINLAGQGLGGYTAFTGQPLQNLFKAEGGITTLPTYYNRMGENKQQSKYNISDLLEAEGRELDEYSEMEKDAMDIESYIDRKNKENLGDRILNMLYAPQRGMKRLFNIPDRSEIGNTYRPNLRRAEGGITSLPVVYRDIGTPPVETTDRENEGFFKMLENAGILTYPGRGPSPIPINVSEEAMPGYLEQGFNVGKEGLSTPEYYKMLEESEYDRGTEALANLPPLDQSNINMANVFAMNPDDGVPLNPYGFEDTSPKDDTIVPNIIPQKVFKEELLDNEDILRRPVPEIMTMDEALALQGTPIADSIDTNTLILNALEKMEAPDGSIPALKQSIRDAYSPDRIKSLEETASRNLAMDQGLGLIKAFSKSDPTQGIVGNLSTQLGDIATNIGPAQKEYAANLAALENMPFEQAEAIYNVDKDTLTNLVQLASKEKTEAGKLGVMALSEDMKNIFDTIERRKDRDETYNTYDLDLSRANLLKDLEQDTNILKLYNMELISADNRDATRAAANKSLDTYNKDLLKLGIMKAGESKNIQDHLARVMFGGTFNEETGQVFIDGEPLDAGQQDIYSKYYAFAVQEFAKERMIYIQQGGPAGDYPDEAFARIGIIAQRAKEAYDDKYKK